MNYLTLEEIKTQCVIDQDETEDDQYLQMLASAAEDQVQSDLNRNLYADSDPDEDSNGLVVGARIKMAMLLLVAHWYRNREATSELTIKEVPLAYDAIIRPHRLIPL